MSETKKVQITLAALTRVEFTQILEVPWNITKAQLMDLVHQRHEDVDGNDYRDDPESRRRRCFTD